MKFTLVVCYWPGGLSPTSLAVSAELTRLPPHWRFSVLAWGVRFVLGGVNKSSSDSLCAKCEGLGDVRIVVSFGAATVLVLDFCS